MTARLDPYGYRPHQAVKGTPHGPAPTATRVTIAWLPAAQVIEASLRDALDPSSNPARARLSVAYQPIVELDSGRIVEVEALARLHDPVAGPICPDRFIPVAERTGLIHALGARVLAAATRAIAEWHGGHPGRARGLAVNISPFQLSDPGLVDEVAAALPRPGLPPAQLSGELTETAMPAGGHDLDALRRLRDLGVGIVLDDLGAGHAGLDQLSRLPLTGIKLDRRYAAALPDDPTTSAIVRALVAMATELGWTCVVEGIETPAQLAALQSLAASAGPQRPSGLLRGQGHLIGRPASRP